MYVCMYVHILTVKQQIWSRCCCSSHRRGALTGKLRVEKKAEDIHNWCQAKLNFPLRGIKGNPISPFYSSTSRAMSRLSSLLASSSAQEQLLCVFYSSAAAYLLLLLFPQFRVLHFHLPRHRLICHTWSHPKASILFHTLPSLGQYLVFNSKVALLFLVPALSSLLVPTNPHLSFSLFPQ